MQHISDGMPMLEAVKAFRPTCLLGLSTQKDVFTEDIVRATAAVSTPTKPVRRPDGGHAAATQQPRGAEGVLERVLDGF